MKRKFFSTAVLGLTIVALGAGGRAADFDEAMAKAKLDYAERLRLAGEELARVRERIANEKAPLLREMRAAEDRVITTESQRSQLETGQEQFTSDQRKILRDLDGVRKNATYLVTLAHDSLKTTSDSLAPGEEQLIGDRLQGLQQKLEDASAGPPVGAAVDVVEFIAERVQRTIGGSTAPGQSLFADGSAMAKGTFVFVGPETFFRAEQGGRAGTVRLRENSPYPIAYALPEWNAADAAALMEGKIGRMAADAAGGKALRLRETRGTLWEHIEKGGVVAYAILVVGLVALVLVITKLRDISRMAIEGMAATQVFLGHVANGARSDAEAMLPQMKVSTRELYACGLRHAREPKTLLEERLEAVLLGQRLLLERRLPLLAVIATAAPLMGLLGTVVGMVKTFALITVFGTGNAGKLSSGISEVLVATELGLAVAIPTLVIHGFLSHRIHKSLALLERQALEFITANEIARVDLRDDPEPSEEVPA